jgi:hypothetical protein
MTDYKTREYMKEYNKKYFSDPVNVEKKKIQTKKCMDRKRESGEHKCIECGTCFVSPKQLLIHNQTKKHLKKIQKDIEM